MACSSLKRLLEYDSNSDFITPHKAMLTIRPEQYEAMRQVALNAYQAELLKHYRVFAPELFRVAGEEQFRIFIQYGTEKALGIGLKLRGPMRLFIDIMCILGQDFDIDPQYQPLWPEGDPAKIPMPFAQRLQTNFVDFLNQCVGKDKILLAHALKKILPMSIDPGNPFRSWTREQFAHVYPQKLEYMGDVNFTSLLDTCDETAERAQIEKPPGRLLVLILAVCFGANFLSNPLYPWVAKRLIANAPEDIRVEKTLTALRIYASEMLDNLKKGT